jgi:hypothetical protein
MLRKRNTGPADVRSGLLEAYSTKHKTLDQKVTGGERPKGDSDNNRSPKQGLAQLIGVLPDPLEERMTHLALVNKPVGDNARKAAMKKRTQRKSKVMGKPAWTKRDRTSGEFLAVKKSARKFKGLRREKA